MSNAPPAVIYEGNGPKSDCGIARSSTENMWQDHMSSNNKYHVLALPICVPKPYATAHVSLNDTSCFGEAKPLEKPDKIQPKS